MTQFGAVRYSRAVRGAVWTQFREGGAALRALQAGVVTVGGVEWQVFFTCVCLDSLKLRFNSQFPCPHAGSCMDRPLPY